MVVHGDDTPASTSLEIVDAFAGSRSVGLACVVTAILRSA